MCDWNSGQEISAQLCVEQVRAQLPVNKMKQKTGDISYVEKQIQRIENKDDPKKDDDLSKLSSSPSFPPAFFRSFSTSSAGDTSTFNNAAMDVLDIKTMLLRMKRLLEQVTYSYCTYCFPCFVVVSFL